MEEEEGLQQGLSQGLQELLIRTDLKTKPPVVFLPGGFFILKSDCLFAEEQAGLGTLGVHGLNCGKSGQTACDRGHENQRQKYAAQKGGIRLDCIAHLTNPSNAKTPTAPAAWIMPSI